MDANLHPSGRSLVFEVPTSRYDSSFLVFLLLRQVPWIGDDYNFEISINWSKVSLMGVFTVESRP